LVSKAQSSIYLLANGKVLQAGSTSRIENLEVEIRDHVKTFHHLFFTLDPDDKAIRTSVRLALYLGDNSIKQEYDNLQESGYYSGIISGNISQKISIDSVITNTTEEPYTFRCFATQKIIRSTSVLTRSLITSGHLREVSRSDNNPHGFLIEKWVIEENRDVQTLSR
jgi:conjugative transposon TraK protein